MDPVTALFTRSAQVLRIVKIAASQYSQFCAIVACAETGDLLV